MGLKYTKRAMTSYEVHRFFHDLEISFFPDTSLESDIDIDVSSAMKFVFIK